MLTVKGGGRHANDHPIQWTDAKTKICAKRERQACDLSPYRDPYEDICGGIWPTPNAIVLTREMDKEKCVMFNVKFFATFRSNEVEVHTAFDFKNSAEWGGGWGEVRNKAVKSTTQFPLLQNTLREATYLRETHVISKVQSRITGRVAPEEGETEMRIEVNQ